MFTLPMSASKHLKRFYLNDTHDVKYSSIINTITILTLYEKKLNENLSL